MRLTNSIALAALGLLACSQGGTVIAGTYNGTMTRSASHCTSVPPPASATATVQIVDDTSAHSIHILGAQPCDLDYTISDYGGIGYVTAAHPGCAFQPAGLLLDGTSDFSPREFTLRWSSSGAADGGAGCVVADHWTIKRP